METSRYKIPGLKKKQLPVVMGILERLHIRNPNLVNVLNGSVKHQKLLKQKVSGIYFLFVLKLVLINANTQLVKVLQKKMVQKLLSQNQKHTEFHRVYQFLMEQQFHQQEQLKWVLRHLKKYLNHLVNLYLNQTEVKLPFTVQKTHGCMFGNLQWLVPMEKRWINNL